MNERIRELAEQATEIVETAGPQSRGGWSSSYARFDREKFAELILKDVENIIWKAEPKPFAIIYDMYKHFGVKK